MTAFHLRVASTLVLTQALAAQVPTDHVLILEGAGGPFSLTRWVLADVFGGGETEVPLQWNPLWLVFPPTGIAVDRASTDDVYVLNVEGSAGIERVSLGLLAVPTAPLSQPWTQSGGARIRIGTTRIFTLRSGGIVEGTPKAGGSPFVLLQRPDAVDIAVAGSLLYIACRDAGNPSSPAPLIEINLQTAVQRVVGLYPDVTRIAASTALPIVAVGTASGVLGEIDATTGNVLGWFLTGGPVVGVAYSRQGALVHAVTTPAGFDVWSALASGPIHSSYGAFVDLDVAAAATPSVVAFGNGCGAGAAVGWGATSLPSLGNAAFQISIDQAPTALPAVLFFGASRGFASSLGVALPVDLASLAPGCSLLVDPIVPFVVPVSTTGTASQSLPIPGTPTLAGVEWSGQVFVIDPSVGPLGLAASRGIACRLDF